MNSGALISVIIPVFNAGPYLAEAIRSVEGQDYEPNEILVIDDGSTDESAAVAQQFERVHYHCQERSGAGVARNVGVKMAKGDLLAFLDADDVWLPGKLSRQMSIMESEPELEAVFTHAVQFRESADMVESPLAGYFPGTMLIRRAAFLRIGNFATDRAVRETFEWQARAVAARLHSAIVPEVFYRRRIHATNRGLIEPNTQNYLEVLKASLDRRRQQGE